MDPENRIDNPPVTKEYIASLAGREDRFRREFEGKWVDNALAHNKALLEIAQQRMMQLLLPSDRPTHNHDLVRESMALIRELRKIHMDDIAERLGDALFGYRQRFRRRPF